jgi:hypothetical protein
MNITFFFGLLLFLDLVGFWRLRNKGGEMSETFAKFYSKAVKSERAVKCLF